MSRLMVFCILLYSGSLTHEEHVGNIKPFLEPTGIDSKEEVSSADPGPRSTAETTQVPEIDLFLGKVKDLKRPNLTGIEVPVYVNSPKGARFKLGNVSHVGHHKYYNSFLHVGPMAMKNHWIAFDNLGCTNVDTISHQYKNFTDIVLSFEFPFYGHKIKNLSLATGGFIGTGSLSHIAPEKYQYIAPLMANFHADKSASSVQYFDNGTAFMVQWSNVVLEKDDHNRKFTFQATLLQTGDIIFGYKNIPIPIPDIIDSSHPVKVGISDAYFIDENTLYTYSKTLYDYHKVEMKNFNIVNGSFIFLEALPTCLSFKNCQACTSAAIGFDCKWCRAAGLCSDVPDRYKQSWMLQICNFVDSTSTFACDHENSAHSNSSDFSSTDSSSTSVYEGMSLVLTFVILVCASVIIVWLIYAYRNPQTPSGQFLIRYRPGKWKFKSTDAKYSPAATEA